MQEKQLTIMFHIDDLLISHDSSGIVTEYTKRLDAACGTQDQLADTRGKKHECLSMTMDFDVEDGVALTQCHYVKKLRNDVPADVKQQRRNAPASEDIFKLDQKSPLLNAEKKDERHKITTRRVSISQRSKPDMQLATGCHYTIVKEPTVNDREKLKKYWDVCGKQDSYL